MTSFLSLDDTILRSVEENGSDNSFENDKDIVLRTKLKIGVTTLDKSFHNLNENENQWHDNTFCTEAFTELEDCNIKDMNIKSPNQICEELNIIVNDNVDHVEGESERERNERTATKRHTLMTDSISSTKRNCTEINQGIIDKTILKSNSDFFGLPDAVKSLIFKIKGIEDLYKWQKECLNLEAVRNRKNLIYALPTSGGKTLVSEILMLKEIMCHKKNVIFILPFVAIVQEKVQSLAPFALELGFLIEEYAAAKGIYPPKKRRKKKSIYICTIEKGLGLVNSLIEENRLKEVGLIVVDELHLLGESGGRGGTLEGLLAKVLYVNENIHIIGMSATIGNLEEIAQFLDAVLYTGTFRPVELREYVKCDDSIWLFDSTTEELLTDLKKINYRYSREVSLIDPDKIGGLVMDVIPNDSCLIFCATRKNCENVALLLSRVLFKSFENHKPAEKQTLINALKTEEGLCPILSKTIKFGVAYHHSGLTSEERKLLEDAFRNGTLCVICCTSTLAAGVNLPARRVILRSPYVGNQFMSLSKYKQMIGRAGRAGMGTIGESILICKSTELLKVKELLISRMDDCLSTLHIDKDRGINNLILSAIMLSIAKTRNELHNLVSKTLLSIQQQRLNVCVKKVADEAITVFLKSGIMKPINTEDLHRQNSKVSVVIPSQNIENCQSPILDNRKRTILLTKETKLQLCDLGRAAMKGCIDLDSAYTLYEDLKLAQKHLILLDHLHLLYLVTPYDIVTQVKPSGLVYYDVVTSFSEDQMQVARLLGINEVTIMKIRDGFMPKNVELRIIQRFYVTLMLYELWNHHAVYAVSEKFQVNRGIIQNLLNSVSSFASSVVRFCEELEEFWAFKNLLEAFGKKLSYCCPLELEALMDLPYVKIGRARQLYNAGYRTVQSIAAAKLEDLQGKIPYLHQKVVAKMIEAAKLLILEKVENLKDEAEDILEGINISLFNIDL